MYMYLDLTHVFDVLVHGCPLEHLYRSPQNYVRQHALLDSFGSADKLS
jgi:hypothetical protein